MELEAVSPPPVYGVQMEQPAKQKMETHANAGPVRVPGSLGFEPAHVDCDNCRSRMQTSVEDVPSQATTIAQLVCCLVGVPCCCITYFIPKKFKWYFDHRHKCSQCGKDIAFVSHSQKSVVPESAPSRYGK